MINLGTKCFHHDKTWNASFMFLMKSFWRECRPPTKHAKVLQCSRYTQSEVDSVWISVFVLQKCSYSSMICNIFSTVILGYAKLQILLFTPSFVYVDTPYYVQKENLFKIFNCEPVSKITKSKNPSVGNQLQFGVKMDSGVLVCSFMECRVLMYHI